MQCCSVQEAARLHSSAAAFQQPAQLAAQQRQLSSSNAALHPPPAQFIYFFFEGCDLLGLLASCPSLFFFGHLLGSCCWGTLRDTEGVKRVIWGSGAWVADASILKNVWIDIAYSAWQKASVKPAVAKMAVNVRSAD